MLNAHVVLRPPAPSRPDELSYACHVTVDGAGAVILGGRRQPSLIDNDGLIIKLDPDGAQLWTHDLVGSGHEAVFDVTVLADDSLVAVGAYTQISGSTDIWVSRIAP